MSKSVLTLIASPDKKILTRPLAARVAARLTQEGAMVMETNWLAEEEACDIIFTRIEPERGHELALEVIGDQPIDAVAQATGTRQKRLLIADMDSTIITIECIDEIADYADVKEKVSAITERAMRGEIDFISALSERVALLKGLSENILQKVYDERVGFMPGARALVATMRANGAYTMLISGGFDFFTSRVREALKFDMDRSNTFDIKNGKLTGKVIPPVLDKNAKLQSLMEMSAQRGISIIDTLAVGDGANDVPMLMAAGIGVAYHAKPVVQQAARARVNHADLRALLYIQGYRQEDFAA